MKSVLFILFYFTAFNLSGQSAEILWREGDVEMENGRYEVAIAFYQDALEIDEDQPAAHFGLAEAYRKTFQYALAEPHYRIVRNSWSERFPLSIYYYGLTLKLTGNFEMAAEEFAEFISFIGDSKRYPNFYEQAYVEKAGAELALVSMNRSDIHPVHFDAPVNSPYNDFSPVVFTDYQLMLTSGRVSKVRLKRDLKYGEGYMKHYVFTHEDSVWLENSDDILKEVNSKFHDGNGCFNSDKSKYYFTSCGRETTHCMIYVTRRTIKGWSKPDLLNSYVNRPGYDSKQPALSPGGDSLFFVSDRPGGIGNNDIWVSVTTRSSEGWRPPVNLGKKVNTSFNELSPRVVNDSTIMFSSEGHQNYGGYDMYFIKWGKADTVLINPGFPFSSSRDDGYPEFDKRKVFWSSNRDGGLGNFDIYMVEFPDLGAYLSQIFESLPSAHRADVGQKEAKQMLNAKNYLSDDIYGYEKLTIRQKQLVNDIIRTRKNGTTLPSELSYLAEDEKALLIEIAEKRMKVSGTGN